jgi:hypothetical protein
LICNSNVEYWPRITWVPTHALQYWWQGNACKPNISYILQLHVVRLLLLAKLASQGGASVTVRAAMPLNAGNLYQMHMTEVPAVVESLATTVPDAAVVVSTAPCAKGCKVPKEYQGITGLESLSVKASVQAQH